MVVAAAGTNTRSHFVKSQPFGATCVQLCVNIYSASTPLHSVGSNTTEIINARSPASANWLDHYIKSHRRYSMVVVWW